MTSNLKLRSILKNKLLGSFEPYELYYYSEIDRYDTNISLLSKQFPLNATKRLYRRNEFDKYSLDAEKQSTCDTVSSVRIT